MGGRQFPKSVKKKNSPEQVGIPQPAPKQSPMEKKKHHGRDLGMAAVGAIVEYLAIVLGAYWLAWFGVLLLFGAFYEYTKEPLSRFKYKLAVRVVVACAMLIGGLWLVKLNKDSLAAYFHFVYVGEVGASNGASSNGSMVLFLVDMHNGGKPSIAENYRLSASLDNGVTTSDVAPNFTIRTINKIDGRKLATIQNSWLYNKTLTPIPTGGLACGWIMFMLPDIPYDDVKKGRMTTWKLSFADVDAKRHYAILRTAMEGSCCEKSPHNDPCVEDQLNLAALD